MKNGIDDIEHINMKQKIKNFPKIFLYGKSKIQL